MQVDLNPDSFDFSFQRPIERQFLRLYSVPFDVFVSLNKQQ